MDQLLQDVPLRLRPTVEMLLKNSLGDERIRSVWLEGSLATGLADDWSDIDLHLAVKKPDSFSPIDWLESQVDLILSDAIPGVKGAAICLTAEWIHIDLTVHCDNDLSPTVKRRVLVNRDDSTLKSPYKEQSPALPFFPEQDVRIFLYFLGKTVASVRRGDLIALSRATATMRDDLLVGLLLAENGIPKERAIKRVGQHLSDEQIQCLEDVPAFRISEISLRETQQSVAATYLGRARKLAETCSANWPYELEQATKRLVESELQMRW